jgi:hypothetical protein
MNEDLKAHLYKHCSKIAVEGIITHIQNLETRFEECKIICDNRTETFRNNTELDGKKLKHLQTQLDETKELLIQRNAYIAEIERQLKIKLDHEHTS